MYTFVLSQVTTSKALKNGLLLLLALFLHPQFQNPHIRFVISPGAGGLLGKININFLFRSSTKITTNERTNKNTTNIFALIPSTNQNSRKRSAHLASTKSNKTTSKAKVGIDLD
jgi:hypothetical protein